MSSFEGTRTKKNNQLVVDAAFWGGTGVSEF